MRASRDLMADPGDTRQTMIEKLKAQIDFLYKAVHKANQYFWPAFIDPTDHLLIGSPEEWGPGGVDGMELILQYNWNAWAEVPRAVDFIKAMVQRNVLLGHVTIPEMWGDIGSAPVTAESLTMHSRLRLSVLVYRGFYMILCVFMREGLRLIQVYSA